MMDKFPCAACEALPTCEDALNLGGLGMAFEEEGNEVTTVSIKCPKDGITYTAKRKATTNEKE